MSDDLKTSAQLKLNQAQFNIGIAHFQFKLWSERVDTAMEAATEANDILQKIQAQEAEIAAKKSKLAVVPEPESEPKA